MRPRQGGLPGREDKAVTGVEKELRENVGEPLLAIIGWGGEEEVRPTAKGKTDAEENRLCGSRVRHKLGKSDTSKG